MSASTRPCVVLFSRSPEREGKVKRLGPAAPLFALARRRVAEAAGRLDVDLFLVGDGPTPSRAQRLPQRGSSFGEKLSNALADVEARGYGRVVVVPSDVPSISVTDLAAAFETVERGGVALGPSPDGGVYLLGLHAGDTTLLSGVRWLTPFVAADIVTKALELGVSVRWLESRRDVDDRKDLAALASDDGLDAELRDVLLLLRGPARKRPHAARCRVSSPASCPVWARPPPATPSLAA